MIKRINKIGFICFLVLSLTFGFSSEKIHLIGISNEWESQVKFSFPEPLRLPDSKAGYGEHNKNKDVFLSKAGTLEGVQGNKSNSPPAGVAKEWLNELKDENGNKIFPDSQRQFEDPETDALQRRVFDGFNSGDRYGESVSNAGDVNGDGYDDIIIGAWAYNSTSGRVYIYFGGLIMNNVPDVIITGLTITGVTSSQFGFSVSSAGDVNGDGYSDVIIGAHGYISSRGIAYIFYGGANMNNVADVVMTGESMGILFGFSVSGTGDVNGDGYSDVIVGAYGYNGSTGRAYIFHGGASMNNGADVTMSGEPSSQFGFSVSSAGDVNGDGYSDVIVGAPSFNGSAGRTYIIYGGGNMNAANVIMTGEPSSRFGHSASEAGDVNGDGFSDVIVGAYTYNSIRGRAYVFYGEANMNNVADITMTGEAINNYFGLSVSEAGDMNGDGYSDVIVGAIGYNGSLGRAYIFFGGESMNNVAAVIMTGESTSAFLGLPVSTAGDVNGDGYSEVIVGAHGHNNYTGRAYIFNYYMNREIIPDIKTTGEAANTVFGHSVSTAGDVNGDGYSDVIVGAYGYNLEAGRIYIYHGGPNMDNSPDIIKTGTTNFGYGERFGWSVSTAGDVNADGYSDIIVGAPVFWAGTILFVGRAYIYFGPNMIQSLTITGETGNSDFGHSVSTAGDVNGDGYSDVIIGAHKYNSIGKVNIYYGGASMNIGIDVAMTGSTNSKFGNSVSTAGDVNGDGYSDVIIGEDKSGANVYIFLGGANMDNSPDVIMNGTSNEQFGFSVSTAGDFNRDGYSDVIVGANSLIGSSGKAYIFLGKASMDNTPDITLSDEPTNASFGYSVSSAGDVNADGFSDVIVGAYVYNNTAGRAYIHLGEAGMSSRTSGDVIMSGEATNNYFGFSVSGAGDVNGDGYSDVISGAKFHNTSTGRADIFLASKISIKPILLFVKDVPNDEGGKVTVKWARSGFDVRGINKITDYVLYRSEPPVGGGFAWEEIAVMDATNRPFYSFIADTPNDSISTNSGALFFRVIARRIDVSSYPAITNSSASWISNIRSGHSIDNLPPLEVQEFTATPISNNVLLSWNKNREPDLYNYILYRSTSSSIDPDNEPSFATVTDTTYLDTSPLSGINYFIVAQDSSNNKSPVSIAGRQNNTEIPKEFALQQNYPNPFNPATKIDYELPITNYITLRIYDIAGKEVATLVNEQQNPGRYSVQFDGSNFASGIYFYRIKAGDPSSNSGQGFLQTKKMLLIK